MNIRSYAAALSLLGTIAVLPNLASARTPAGDHSTMTGPTTGVTSGVFSSQTAPVVDAMTQGIDLNSASKPELMKLAGIGNDRSDAIIRARPFHSKDELVNRHIVPALVYGQIEHQVTVR